MFRENRRKREDQVTEGGSDYGLWDDEETEVVRRCRPLSPFTFTSLSLFHLKVLSPKDNRDAYPGRVQTSYHHKERGEFIHPREKLQISQIPSAWILEHFHSTLNYERSSSSVYEESLDSCSFRTLLVLSCESWTM
ncbi:unnamed protein product [Lepeophtheirus salmonis]|uniref:(salmon louse) hypothetical protein n=1 Tax=Lepeophtheirus salmonis TaxID=72036 RepID=A0A7R8CLQ0_LEPSM|nr:unnamed protein product [Lepeophtheirus salmonis]CAF2860078.1 unnamed protein product [Lepeophtheirus salmonis]